MKVFYPYSELLPSEKARALQVVNTCYGLAKAGLDTKLYAGLKKSRLDILKYYGLRPIPNLSFISAPLLREFRLFGFKFSWEGIFKHNCIGYLKREKENFFIYTRHLKIAFSLLKKFPHLPLIYEAHEIFFLTKKNLFSLEDFVLSNSKGLVFITHSLRKKVEEFFTLKAPSVVIPDGVNLELIEEAKKKALEGEIVYVGQLYPWKGVKTLARAMVYLPGVKLTMVGGGSDKEREEIERIVDELKLKDRVKLTGFLPYFEALRFMTGARVLVLPLEDEPIARYFTSPLKLFEYMASAVPIVASDLPTIREILRPEETGILVKPGDERVLAEAIARLLKDKSLSQTIANKAYHLSREYSWKKRAERIAHFIKENLCP